MVIKDLLYTYMSDRISPNGYSSYVYHKNVLSFVDAVEFAQKHVRRCECKLFLFESDSTVSS